MHIIWFVLFASLAMAAQEHSTVLPANFDHENDIDSDEVSDLAMAIYFDQDDPELFNMVFPKIKAHLRNINELPAHAHHAIRVDLAKIKAHPVHHRRSTMSSHYPDLNIYLTKIVNKALKEAFVEERQHSNEVMRQKNCYKIAAITGGILAGVLTAGGTLIAHFVQPTCPTS